MEQHCQCLFCSEFSDIVSKQKRLAWTTLCRLAFLSMKRKDNGEYMHVRDLFNFFNDHWNKISHFDQLKKKTWKKSILDALNHSDYFQSGINQFHTNGYWKLMDSSVPSIKNRKSKKLEEKQIVTIPSKDSLKKEDIVRKHVFDIPKDERNLKENIERRELRENRELKELKENKEIKELHDLKELRDIRENRDDRFTRRDDEMFRDPYYGYNDYRMYYRDYRDRMFHSPPGDFFK